MHLQTLKAKLLAEVRMLSMADRMAAFHEAGPLPLSGDFTMFKVWFPALPVSSLFFSLPGLRSKFVQRELSSAWDTQVTIQLSA